jgi:hypothetical protein
MNINARFDCVLILSGINFAGWDIYGYSIADKFIVCKVVLLFSARVT